MQHKEIRMTNQYFSQKQINPIEKPMKEIIDLNMKVFQNFSSFNPLELFSVLKPEETLEKNMNTFIQNGHKALDYMQQMFSIMGTNWSSISDNVTKNTKQIMDQAQTKTEQHMKEAMDLDQRISKKVTAKMHDVTKKNVKQAQSIVRKNTQDTGKVIKQASSTVSSTLKGTMKPSMSKSKSDTTKNSQIGVGSRKPEVKNMSSSVKEKPKTMNKIESRVLEPKKSSPGVKPPIKEMNFSINKDKPLM